MDNRTKTHYELNQHIMDSIMIGNWGEEDCEDCYSCDITGTCESCPFPQ